ncbi:MAG TPA: GEVED domain-containing protein, partial [Fibrella sp.]
MSSITRSGLTPGTTVYLRLWEYFNDNSGTFSICVSTIVPLTNDNCVNAVPLTVGTSCSYTTYTNAGATASTGVPAPGCASYIGGDIWFSAVVPANGVLTVDTQTGVILDSGIAFYSGTCGALTLLQCDDDSSVNGAMSTITRTGLTPGSTIYIRVWEYSNDGNGTFGICATTLGACAQTPSSLIATAGSTTATISWTAAIPAPGSGYQYYYSTSPTAPIATTTPSGSTGAGITTANLTALTPSTTYYFWVRSNCNGTDRSAWVGSSFFTGYCSSTSTNSTDYIDNFSTSGGFLNISNIGSGYSPGGYGNFTGQVVSQTAGSSINFTAVYFDGVIYTYGFAIWVDWNNDLDFTDPGEAVYAPGTTAASHTGSFAIPGATSTGNYRMRIRAVYATANPGACGSVTYGETEDYTLSVSNPLPCSSNPTNLGVVTTSSSTATITWSPASTTPANGYQYYYSTSSTTPGPATFSGSTTSSVVTANLIGLTAGVTYYVWVRSNCGGALGQGAWIGPLTF